MNGADAVYRFGRFELQPRERRLLGERRPVPLPGKAFDLLVCLVSRAPRLVKKDELLALVWPDTIVEETNLNYTVSLIRKALQDGQDGQRYIETVPRQGYRFVADVDIAIAIEVEAGRDERAPTPAQALDRDGTQRPVGPLASRGGQAAEMPTPRSPLVQRESEIEALAA